MAFYDWSKEKRQAFALELYGLSKAVLEGTDPAGLLMYFSDEDTYIRKTAYLALGKVVKHHPVLTKAAIEFLKHRLGNPDFKVRQTAVNAAGEIGKWDFESVAFIFD